MPFNSFTGEMILVLFDTLTVERGQLQIYIFLFLMQGY